MNIPFTREQLYPRTVEPRWEAIVEARPGMQLFRYKKRIPCRCKVLACTDGWVIIEDSSTYRPLVLPEDLFLGAFVDTTKPWHGRTGHFKECWGPLAHYWHSPYDTYEVRLGSQGEWWVVRVNGQRAFGLKESDFGTLFILDPPTSAQLGFEEAK